MAWFSYLSTVVQAMSDFLTYCFHQLLRNNYLLASAIFDAYPLQECDSIVDLIHRFYGGNDLDTPFLKACVEREIRRTSNYYICAYLSVTGKLGVLLD
jgi:hypothetical protein